ncbi:MAG TPA: TolC family protein [Bacillota bacterium]|nr:TolC family protein [Bacillota bacterium]
MRPLRILLVLAGLGTALAQPTAPAVRQLSLEDCIRSALEKNLDIRVARYTPALALSDLRGAYAGYDPGFSIDGRHNFNMSGGGFNPSISTFIQPTSADQNTFNSSLGGLLPSGLNYSLSGNVSESYGRNPSPFDQSGGRALLTLQQPLLKNFWIDQTRYSIKVAKNRLKYSELTLKQQIMQTVNAVEQAYYDLIYSRENVVVQQKAVELAQRLVMENRKRLEVGALAELDVKQAEAQAASSLAALIRAQQTLGTQLEVMKGLIGDDFAAWANVDLMPTDKLTTERRLFNLQDSWSKALTLRPDLQQSKLDIERQGVALKYTFNQLFPQLDLVGSYGHNAGGANIREFNESFQQLQEGSRPLYSYGALLSIPLSNTRARANYKSSKLTMEQLLLELKRLEQNIITQVHNDVGTIQADFQSVAATRQAREYAEAALDAEQKKLESGKSTTYTVLQMQRDLTNARGNEIQAIVAYNKALAQLSFDEGTMLERRAIDVEVK